MLTTNATFTKWNVSCNLRRFITRTGRTAVLLEELGKIIAPGGSGVVISSQSGHRLGGALTEEQNFQLATTPTEELLNLPFLKTITDTLKAISILERVGKVQK